MWSRRGDKHGGMVMLKLNQRDAGCRVLSQTRDFDGRRAWLGAFNGDGFRRPRPTLISPARSTAIPICGSSKSSTPKGGIRSKAKWFRSLHGGLRSEANWRDLAPGGGWRFAKIAELFRISAGGVADYIWQLLASEFPGLSLLDIGECRYGREGEAFSYQHCTIADRDGEVAGMLHGYEMPAGTAPEDDPVLRPYQPVDEVGTGHKRPGLIL